MNGRGKAASRGQPKRGLSHNREARPEGPTEKGPPQEGTLGVGVAAEGVDIIGTLQSSLWLVPVPAGPNNHAQQQTSDQQFVPQIEFIMAADIQISHCLSLQLLNSSAQVIATQQHSLIALKYAKYSVQVGQTSGKVAVH